MSDAKTVAHRVASKSQYVDASDVSVAGSTVTVEVGESEVSLDTSRARASEVVHALRRMVRDRYSEEFAPDTDVGVEMDYGRERAVHDNGGVGR